MKTEKKNTNPVKAIRAYCLECTCGSTAEVKLCPIDDCPLFPFRFGKNPYRKQREMTEEERRALADRLKEAKKNLDNSVTGNSEDSLLYADMEEIIDGTD